MTTSDTRARIGLRDRFMRVFADAAEQRASRQDFVTLGDGRHELGWVLHERTVMLDAVNQARAERGVAPVTVQTVRRAERMAEGHIDYAEKWAIYCAEIVLDEWTGRY